MAKRKKTKTDAKPSPSKITNLNARSVCPITSSLEIIGDRWTLIIVRDLVMGRTQFKEFQRCPEKIATNILTDRLNKLIERGLVEKIESEHFPGRYTYHLTDLGLTLKPVIKAIADWGIAHIEGTEKRIKPKS